MNTDIENQESGSFVENGNVSNAVGAGFHLKVLTGRHSGAIMLLLPGRYSLGQDEECDFIFLDDAFLGGRVVIDVTGLLPKISVTGIVKAYVGGGVVEPEARPLDSYEAVEVGATRFALGPANLPWPEPVGAQPEAEASAPDAGPSPAGSPAETAASGTSGPQAKPRNLRGIIIAASAAAAVLIAAGFSGWRHLRQVPDPVALLSGILAELRLPEISVLPAESGFLLKGFLETEAEREALLMRVNGFTPPVKTSIISAEETKASIQGVLDLYKMDFAVTVGPMGKTVITGINDNARLGKEIAESVRQGVQSETEVEERFHNTGTVLPFLNRLLAAKVLDHKIRLEVQRGRLIGWLVKGQMDVEEMKSWNTIRESFKVQFGMDLDEKWTDRLSPALQGFSAAAKELDTQLVGVTVGELSYITLRNRRKYFEGARLNSGLTVKSIEKDRIVLNLGNIEQNYFLKRGSK